MDEKPPNTGVRNPREHSAPTLPSHRHMTTPEKWSPLLTKWLSEKKNWFQPGSLGFYKGVLGVSNGRVLGLKDKAVTQKTQDTNMVLPVTAIQNLFQNRNRKEHVSRVLSPILLIRWHCFLSMSISSGLWDCNRIETVRNLMDKNECEPMTVTTYQKCYSQIKNFWTLSGR